MSDTLNLFDLQSDSDTLVVVPTRDLGSLASEALDLESRKIVARLVSDTGLKHVVVDFDKVSYFGSVVVSTLVKLHKTANGRSGRVALCNLSDYAQQLLKLFKLDSYWSICESREAALEAVRA